MHHKLLKSAPVCAANGRQAAGLGVEEGHVQGLGLELRQEVVAPSLARSLFEEIVFLTSIQCEFFGIDHGLLFPYLAGVLLPRRQLEVPCLIRRDDDFRELLIMRGRKQFQKLILAVLGRSG